MQMSEKMHDLARTAVCMLFVTLDEAEHCVNSDQQGHQAVRK
jgi:hypothetical protein